MSFFILFTYFFGGDWVDQISDKFLRESWKYAQVEKKIISPEKKKMKWKCTLVFVHRHKNLFFLLRLNVFLLLTL